MEYPVLDAKATGARIKELRKARHLKVEDIARFMGFESEQAVYKWQRGDSLPTVDNLYALSRLFGTSVDDILRGEREKDDGSSLSVFKRNRVTEIAEKLFIRQENWYNSNSQFEILQ